MKTITMYELLGLIKDGKELPKLENEAEKDFAYYVYDKWGETCNLKDLKKILNDTIQIIEEEKEIPEKLEKYYDEDLEEYVVETYIKGVNYKEIFKSKYDEMIISKLNEVLDYLKSKGD